MAVKFKEDGGIVKHGKLSFLPGGVYGFEDEDAEKYMVAAGWAEPTDAKPTYTFSKEEIDIDPEGTRHSDSGLQMADIMEHGSVEDAKAAGVTPRISEPTLEVQDVVTEAPTASA